MDIELFVLGIGISFVPLLLTIWAATNFTAFFNLDIVEYRYELVYGGLSALLLVLYEHYRAAHRYALVASAIFLISAGVIAVMLLIYNNQPGHYDVKKVITDANVAHYVVLMHDFSIPVFCGNFLIGLALICARIFSETTPPKVHELDRNIVAGSPSGPSKSTAPGP